MLIRYHFFLILLILSSLFQSSFAQTGSFDSSFNGNGILPGNSEMVFAIQPDAKVLTTEKYSEYNPLRTYIKISRFHANGSPDSGFGNNGVVLNQLGYNKTPRRINLCPDGKILILAENNDSSFLIRFLPEGRIDSSFNITGIRSLNFLVPNKSVNVVQIQHDGKILLGGSQGIGPALSAFFITRLNTDGSIDTSFGLSGVATTVFGIHISYPQQSINYTDGSSINGLGIQDDGKIIAAGVTYSELNGVVADSIAVVRYDSHGALDSSFNGNGKIVINPPNPYNQSSGSGGSHATSVALQADGKILVGANLSYMQSHGRWFYANPSIVRINANGSIDQGFGGNGVWVTATGYGNNLCKKIALQSDGKIVLAGLAGDVDFLNPRVLMARVNSNGSNDNSFGQGGIIIPLFTDVNNYPTRSGVNTMELKDHRIYCSIYTYMSTAGSGVFAFKNDGTSLNPQNLRLCNAGNSLVSADLTGSTYQWQMSTDSVQFNNISNSSNFSGVNTATLSFTTIPASWRGYQFRCMVDGGSSNIATIHFSNEWTGAVSSEWENSANWLCGTVPGRFEDVIINSGNVIINSNVTVNSLLVMPAAVLTVTGGYTLIVLN